MKKIFSIILVLAIIGFCFWFFTPKPEVLTPDITESDVRVAPLPGALSASAATSKIIHADASASVNIEYPVLTLSGASASTTAKINQAIFADTLAYEREFFDSVEAAKKDSAGLPAALQNAPADASRRYRVIASSELAIVSVLYSDEQAFPGQAHPSNFFDSAVYDARTGAVLEDRDIAALGKISDLYRVFIAALRAKYALPADTYNLTVDRLPEFAHFIVEDAGLHMYVDQDSVLAHVDGPADVLISWDKLSGLVAARLTK